MSRFLAFHPNLQNVTRNQRISIFGGIAVLIAMWLFPPWFRSGFGGDSSGYCFLFYSKNAHYIDFRRLIAQSVVLGLPFITAFLAFRSSTAKSRNVNAVARQPPPDKDSSSEQLNSEPLDREILLVRWVLLVMLVLVALVVLLAILSRNQSHL